MSTSSYRVGIHALGRTMSHTVTGEEVMTVLHPYAYRSTNYNCQRVKDGSTHVRCIQMLSMRHCQHSSMDDGEQRITHRRHPKFYYFGMKLFPHQFSCGGSKPVKPMTVLLPHSAMPSVMSVKFVQRQQVSGTAKYHGMGRTGFILTEMQAQVAGIQVRDVLCVCFLQDVAGRRPGDSSSMRSREKMQMQEQDTDARRQDRLGADVVRWSLMY